jgi:hypothetical protein
LWITLLISCPDALRSLVNQGFCYFACKKSKFKILYKSST